MGKRKQFPHRDLNPAKIVARAERQDSFRQAQVNRQVAIINRLLENDGSGKAYDEVLRDQTEEIARLTVERDEALARVAELEKELDR